MRIARPVALLLFSTSIAFGQTQTSGFAVAGKGQAEKQAPAQPVPAAAPALPKEPTEPQTSARAEAATTVQQSEAQEPKKQNRVVWFLVGAVVVLAIIVAASQ
jgi:hypothetical protein